MKKGRIVRCYVFLNVRGDNPFPYEVRKIMFKPIIEFCISNLASGAQIAKEKLEQDPNLDIIEYGCLSYCGKCNHSLYALVNGEVVTGETPEQLVDHIYQFLEENPLF